MMTNRKKILSCWEVEVLQSIRAGTGRSRQARDGWEMRRPVLDVEAVWQSQYFGTSVVSRKAVWTERRRCFHSWPCSLLLLFYVRGVDGIKVIEKIIKLNWCARIKTAEIKQSHRISFTPKTWRPPTSGKYWKYDRLCIKLEFAGSLGVDTMVLMQKRMCICFASSIWRKP